MSATSTGPCFGACQKCTVILLLMVAAVLVPAAIGSFRNFPVSITIRSADSVTPTSFGIFHVAPSIAAGAMGSFGTLDRTTPREQGVWSDGAAPVPPSREADFVRQFSVVDADAVVVLVMGCDSS